MEEITKTSTGTQTPTQDLELVLSDAYGLAEKAVEGAIGYSAAKMGSDREGVLRLLREGDRKACNHFHYSLAERAAEWLGAWDESIKAIFIYDYDATPEDLCFSELRRPQLLHLLVWVQRKTQALAAILDALDRAVVDGYVKAIGVQGMKHILDVQVVDDEEVQNNIGCGALLHSLHTRPIRIWER